MKKFCSSCFAEVDSEKDNSVVCFRCKEIFCEDCQKKFFINDNVCSDCHYEIFDNNYYRVPRKSETL